MPPDRATQIGNVDPDEIETNSPHTPLVELVEVMSDLHVQDHNPSESIRMASERIEQVRVVCPQKAGLHQQGSLDPTDVELRKIAVDIRVVGRGVSAGRGQRQALAKDVRVCIDRRYWSHKVTVRETTKPVKD